MTSRFINGQTIDSTDFVQSSAGSADGGKAVVLDDAEGKIDRTMLKASFGGTGADGALSISSGTTTLDLGGASIFIKNYSSISITGTGKLAFSNPHANGTIIIIKCKGNFTVTSSASPAIDASGMGANTNSDANNNTAIKVVAGGNGSASSGTPIAGTAGTTTTNSTSILMVKNIFLSCGSGGGNGGGTNGFTCTGAGGGGASLINNGSGGSTGFGTSGGSGGSGGRGGGALFIEVGGAYNVTGIISVAGIAGTNASGTTGSGGGGGGGGCIVIRYHSLTANSGTYTVSGGSGGTGNQGGNGGAGATGYSDIKANTELV